MWRPCDGPHRPSVDTWHSMKLKMHGMMSSCRKPLFVTRPSGWCFDGWSISKTIGCSPPRYPDDSWMCGLFSFFVVYILYITNNSTRHETVKRNSLSRGHRTDGHCPNHHLEHRQERRLSDAKPLPAFGHHISMRRHVHLRRGRRDWARQVSWLVTLPVSTFAISM